MAAASAKGNFGGLGESFRLAADSLSVPRAVRFSSGVLVADGAGAESLLVPSVNFKQAE